ncbi:MAG: cobaltochelatase subunit CobN, partial [Kangiellaceae bacterium]|nr:cobaltochelatase subunit CobN [Kangiellaceae bacterium]
RFLNPEWLKGQMKHDYAGARTMGSEFLEYLWGWQVTNPTLVGDWAWEEVKAVYIDDRYQLQLDQFLAQGHNAHVKSNMLAIMLVAINKNFWRADQETVKQLAGEFADLVAKHGLPGSGHTDPEHPMFPWLEKYLTAKQWQAIAEVIAMARGEEPDTAGNPNQVHRIAEIEMLDAAELANKELDNLTLDTVANVDDRQIIQSNENSEKDQTSGVNEESYTSDSKGNQSDFSSIHWWIVIGLLLLICGGFYRGISQIRRIRRISFNES